MKILLNVSIPGQPKAQERHRWGKGRVYDPNSKDKEDFLWQLRAAVPALRPDISSRIGVRFHIRTTSWTEDADNYIKFYMDALSPARAKRRLPKALRQRVTAEAFAAWGNDNQIDHVLVDVDRGVAQPGVDILVFVKE